VINKRKLCSIALISTAMILMLISITDAAPFAYIANSGNNNVSVIDTATNTITATVPVGSFPYGVAVAPDGTKVYVTNEFDNTVSVIDTATNTVTANVSVGNWPAGVAVTPNGANVYVGNRNSNNVSVINTATNTVTATVPVGNDPDAVVVKPDGTTVYVVNGLSKTVSVIDTATNAVTDTVPVGTGPFGVAVTPDGTKVYVVNNNDNTVFVIDTATNNITANVSVGNQPSVIVITPDGTKAYVTSTLGGNVSIIDTATNTVTATVMNVGTGFGIAVTPDGTFVYVTDYAADKVSSINTTTNTVTAVVPVGNQPLSLGNFIGPLPITPTLAWTPYPLPRIVYGTALDGDLDATAKDPKTGNTVAGNFVYTDDTTAAVVNSGTVLSVGLHILTATFTPTDTTNYTSGGTVNNSITVTPGTPTITWSNPADITYGTPLSSIQLDATSSVPGSFVYNPVAGTVLSAGSGQTLSTVFMPTDTANYTTASASVSINILTPVQKIQQMITLIQGLVTSGKLNNGQANSLIVKLNAAKMSINHENTQAATNELNAFINEVNADIKTGKLSSTDGQTLIDEANAVIDVIK